MTLATNTIKDFEGIIKTAINKAVVDLCKEEFDLASERIIKRKNEVISGVVLQVMSYVKMQERTTELAVLIQKDK